MAKLQINNTDIITESSGNITYASGTYNGTIGSSATFPEGHIVKTTPVIRHSGSLELTNNTITSAAYLNYTCVSSSNKLLLLGVGVINRGTQNGQGALYYYLDGTIIKENQNRDFRDNDEMQIHNHYMDAYSGTKEILLKVQSLSNNGKVIFHNGNGFLIIEFQGPLANASTV